MSNIPTTTPTDNEDMKANTNVNQNTYKRNSKKNEPGINSDLRNFVGETSELEFVLTLVSEKCDKGVTFDVFQEKLKNYVLKKFEKSKDVTPLVTELSDPTVDFETNHCPLDLSDAKAANPMQVRKWEYKYKKFIDRREKLDDNMNKVYGLVIGQCSPALRSTLKGDSEYDVRLSTYDSLWLLKKLKTITAGVDTKGNKAVTLHERTVVLFTT